MIAARLHNYHEALKVEEIDEPKALGPLDVIVKIGAAGLCRTDLHIQEGQWAEKSEVVLPYTPGHENAGWVHEVGSGVTNVEVGDTVIVHPFISCGLCLPCRRGDDMHCVNGEFPGIGRDGGFAQLLQTSARSVIKLDPSLHPTDIAALADAGLTAIHAVKKAIPVLGAGTKAGVIGAGGLGHIGIQCLKAYTPTEIIVVDPNEKALELARELGADHTVKVEGASHIQEVQELTDGKGAQAIIDFVGEKGAVEDGVAMIDDGGSIAREIELSDQFKNMGAQLVREVANKTSDLTGDGTTTATLLAQAIVREGMRALDEGANPMLLRRGIEEATECLVAELRRVARPVEGRDQLLHIATIAAKEDAVIGAAVADALDRVGAEGVVTIEESDAPGVAVDFVEGVNVENGWISPYMVRDRARMETVFEDPYILMTNKPISHAQDLLPALDAVMKAPRPLVVLAEKVD